MKYFKKGQTVYCTLCGIGIVIDVNVFGEYPVRVQFGEVYINYTSDGKMNKEDDKISLFQKAPTIHPNVPLKDEYEDYSFKDAGFLIGKPVISISNKHYHLITNVLLGNKIRINNNDYSFKEFGEYFTFLDGSPCKKLKQ